MNVVLVQLDIAWEDRRANHAAVWRLLDGNLAPGVPVRRPLPPGSLIVLPEMFATGFSMNELDISESADGPTARWLAQLALDRGCWVLAGVAIREDEIDRNEALLFGPDGRPAARYAKLHTFNPGGEGQHYQAGTRTVVAQVGPFKLSPFVCYDLRFPEVFRSAAARGADLLAVIANWPAARVEHWLTLLRARAIENQAYVIGVNRAGRDRSHEYPGRSVVVDPRGNVLIDAGGQQGVVQCELDPEALAAYRREFPVLDDLRKDFVNREA